jgi:hypothetical protein
MYLCMNFLMNDYLDLAVHFLFEVHLSGKLEKKTQRDLTNKSFDLPINN